VCSHSRKEGVARGSVGCLAPCPDGRVKQFQEGKPAQGVELPSRLRNNMGGRRDSSRDYRRKRRGVTEEGGLEEAG